MKTCFSSNAFYFYLALIGAACMPLMAQAQTAPDNGDGPQIATYSTDAPDTKDQNAADDAVRKAREQRERDHGRHGHGDHADATDASGASAASGSPQSAVTLDVQAGTNGGSSGQVFSTSVSLSYKGNGEGASAAISGGAGTAGVVQGKFELDGLRTNDPDPKKGFGGAGFVDGSGQVGTNGTGTIHGVAGAEINGLVNINTSVQCIVAGGIGFGGTYSNEMANDQGATTTTSYGPAAYFGGGCSGRKWDVMLHNDVIVNAARFSDPTNMTSATTEHKLQANYWLNDSIALTAGAKVDLDFRDPKPLADYQLTGGMTFVIGGRGKPSAASTTSTSAN